MVDTHFVADDSPIMFLVSHNGKDFNRLTFIIPHPISLDYGNVIVML